MSLRYEKLSQRPQLFLRLVGIKVEDFEQIMKKLEPLWEKKVVKKYKRPGRFHKLSLSDRTMMLLIYYRSYITHMFLGHLMGIDDSRICRLFRVLEPLVARVTSIDKTRKLSKEEVEHIILDATEQPIERPQKHQRSYFSGKKKRHTIKTEIRITEQGRIVHVSKSHPGSKHDFAVYKKEQPVPRDSWVYADSGYQGLDKRRRNVDIPYKAGKHHPLDSDDKAYNRALSKIRVKVEHAFSQIKRFKIMAERYRNKRRAYHLKFNIIAGIVNIKNGFSHASA